MADISEKELKKEIAKILKNDKKAAPKKVRRKLEDILDTDLSEKKKLIEKLISEYLKKDDQDDDDDEKSEDDDDDEDVGKKKSGKRSAPASKGSSKKARKESSDEEAEDGTNDSESEDDKKKKKKDSGSDSDDDEKELTAAKKKKELTKEDLKDEIAKVLENANLSKTSSKKVRQTLEKKLGIDLLDKKKLIDQLVLDYVSKKGNASDGDEEKKDSGSDDEESNSKKEAELTKEEEELKVEIAKILKNANLAKTSTKKVRQQLEKKMGVDLIDKRKLIDRLVMDYVTEKGGDSDEDEDEEEEKPPKKKKKGSDDNDSDWGKGKAKKAPKAKKGGRGKGGGYTRAYKLSPALSELMGAEEMPRHEVVRRVWDIIKTKQLYDPNNRQFAICDHALYKVFGTTRFRTFGMMKYLKNHFLDD